MSRLQEKDVRPSVDVATLVGEAPAVPCDHQFHDHPDFGHYGPATYYLSKQCPGCEGEPTVYAACQGFIDQYMTLDVWECPRCDEVGSASHFATIIGPVPHG